jgi:hypothetical protein
MEEKKLIRIRFVGKDWDSLRPGEVPYPFDGHLQNRYELEFSDQPDYVISKESRDFYASCVLGYPKAKVRILFAGEAVVPDFNLFDYAIGFDRLDFGDRYFRMNTFNFFSFDSTYGELSKSESQVDAILAQDRRFCNFVYSNGKSNLMRVEMFKALSSYREVDAAGALLRNTERRIETGENWMQAKVDFQKGYKFTAAIENSKYSGYTTEKILHPMSAGSIPIYWGNETVGLEFNQNAFINCHDFDDLDSVVDRVREVDRDDTLYEEILREPWMTPAQVEANVENADDFKTFLFNIFDQPEEAARRRGDGTWVWRYEDVMTQRFRMHRKYFKSPLYRLKRRLQKWGLKI